MSRWSVDNKVAEASPPLPLSGPPAPHRPPALPDRAPTLPDRGPTLPERGPTVPERGPTVSDRGSKPADRVPKTAERASTTPEKQSVTALVNSYQQRMSGHGGRGDAARHVDANRNPGQWQPETSNNNWQGVETTAHFYSSNEPAYGGSSSSQRPASVAGSGGSPALDQRPASRSSGDSELSVSGVSKEKKDKKGVFGGLFSRKKRPQSHM